MQTARTIAGRDVQIITVLPEGHELDDGHAIIGIFTDSNGQRSVETWTRDGRYLPRRSSELDLRLMTETA